MNRLVSDYLRLANLWGSAMSEGDSSMANNIYDEVQSIYKEIVKEGKEDALFGCVDKESDVVRFFAASHLQELNSSRSLNIYEQLCDSQLPFVAVSARHILRSLKR